MFWDGWRKREVDVSLIFIILRSFFFYPVWIKKEGVGNQSPRAVL